MRRTAAGLALGIVAAPIPVIAPVESVEVMPANAASAAAAGDEPPRPLRWLALGDSYSSGEGVDENYGRCAQSPGAYAHEAYHELRMEGFPVGDQDFLACSGAQVPDVTESVDLVEQIEQATGRYDLITLSIGGNDAGFGDVVMDCLMLACVDLGESEDEWVSQVNARIDRVRPRLVTAYGRLIDELLAPGGHIVVVDYPRLFEPPSEWGWYIGGGCETFDKHEAELIRGFADRLNGVIAGVTGAYDNVHLLDVADAFEGHNLCAGWATTNEWINGLSVGWNSNRWPGPHEHSFHPNRAGHAAEAAPLADYIKGPDWSELATPEQRFPRWMRIQMPKGITDPMDADDPLRQMYVGWINGRAVIDSEGNVTGTARYGDNPSQNLVCSGPGLLDVNVRQNITLTGSVLRLSSPLGPDLDLTISFGPASVSAKSSGCSDPEGSAAYFTDPLRDFLDGLEPVHVVVRARETENRYGERYDPVPVTINGERFQLVIE